MLEAIEEPLDSIPVLVNLAIVRPWFLSPRLGRNHRLGTHRFNLLDKSLGIISPVRDDVIGTNSAQQIRGGGTIVGLATGQTEVNQVPVGLC